MSENNRFKMVQVISKGYRDLIPGYTEMKKLTQVQLEICKQESLQDNDIEKLTALLEKRQKLIEAIEEKNKALNNVKGKLAKELGITEVNLTNLKQVMPIGELGEFSEAIAKLGPLLAEINEMDKLNQQLMSEKMGKIKGELQNIQNGKRAYKGYQQNPYKKQPVARFIDKKK
ncbi:putative house-cleaning noncanonical NTP pyrophosphatase (MazG superfamily) [Desulfitispora alkaliphila]|uniref:flagellar export chaperone FlgN n=1 Tax=Desulfitispora alkaliphila TaxID=622674 RepID=UPI003D1E5262